MEHFEPQASYFFWKFTYKNNTDLTFTSTQTHTLTHTHIQTQTVIIFSHLFSLSLSLSLPLSIWLSLFFFLSPSLFHFCLLMLCVYNDKKCKTNQLKLSYSKNEYQKRNFPHQWLVILLLLWFLFHFSLRKRWSI